MDSFLGVYDDVRVYARLFDVRYFAGILRFWTERAKKKENQDDKEED